MSRKIKSLTIYAPKFIIFIISFLNYLHIQAQVQLFSSGAAPSFCVVCPWYETSKFSDVLIILAASIFLLISRRWSYLISILLSGYIVGYGLNFFYSRNMAMLEVWKFVREYELDISLQWETQFVLAGVILGATIFYSIKKNILKSKLKPLS